MKRNILILPLIVVAATLIAACKGEDKKKTPQFIAPKVEKKLPGEPISMQQYNQQKTVEWGGKTVDISIERLPDNTLPMVEDEDGQKFVDNIISLKIVREGKTVMQRQFKKSTFAGYLDEDYKKTGILEGLVFDKVEGDKLRFAASVCHPQTDEYIPLVMLVGHNGSIQIDRDTTMDVENEER